MMNKLEVHAAICDGIKDLYRRKNADYGDSFAKARREIPCYTLGKLYDKFNRFMNLARKGECMAQVDESLDDTLMDLANYAIMELTERELDRLEAEVALPTPYDPPLRRLKDLKFARGNEGEVE